MSATVTKFKGSSTGEILERTDAWPTLKGSQVLVEVHHAGFCGTDLHYLHADQVVGHEGAGVIKEIGPGVRHLKVGQRVGFGWFQGSCGECDSCIVGDGAHCQKDARSQYGDHDFNEGGFSNFAVKNEDFVFPLPDSLSTEEAAPLMCAGMTVFTPMVRYNFKPTDRVGVVGIGALGHLAIQFASKTGSDVVAFSQTEAKKAEALSFGARTFIATGGKKDLKLEGKPIDHLLVCTSQLPEDWLPYIGVMATYGTIYVLTVSLGNVSYPALPALKKDLAFRISTGASTLIYRQMFDFAVLHGVRPQIEKFALTPQGIAEARAKMEKGGVRYKAVMEVQH